MATVNISFTDDLLKEIDRVAREESRSRSEFIREAARAYIERKRRWAEIMRVGREVARSPGLAPADVEREIALVRREERK